MGWVSQFLALLFPRACAGCGCALHGATPKASWDYLCGHCAAELRAVGEEACIHCGVPVYGVITGRRICMPCREKPPAWGQYRGLVRYLGPARRWVRAFKYNNARWVISEWQKLLQAHQYQHLKPWLQDTIVVPVPLHPFKRLIRGFNQSDEFARLLVETLQLNDSEKIQSNNDCLKIKKGRKISFFSLFSQKYHKKGLKNDKNSDNNRKNEKIHSKSNNIIVPLLVRTRYTRQQARLKRKERHDNVKDAFAINPKINLQPFLNKRVIVVDDLLTTGFTLTACVNALKKAGFERVDVFTIARG